MAQSLAIVQGARARGPFAPIEKALDRLREGRMVIVVDDEDRENEGDLTIAADKVTPEAIAFMARYGRGLICLSMTPARLDELEIPLMVSQNTARFETAFCVSITAKGGSSSGVSALDRAATVRAAVDPATRPSDLARPGHVFPLRARPGGVIVRAGQTEAAVDLTRIAGLSPAGVICEVMSDDGTMARVPELSTVAKRHDLVMVTVADLIRYRMRTESFVRAAESAWLPTKYGDFRITAFESCVDGRTHVALVLGDIGDGRDVLVRVHPRCTAGDVICSLRCGCRAELDAALRAIAREGRGVVLDFNQGERDGDAVDRIREQTRPDVALDAAPVREARGLRADQRDYGVGVQVLRALGVRSMRLLSNNPRRLVGIEGYGLTVTDWLPLERPSSEAAARTDNRRQQSAR
jgi:3,4-dihydroxy 2-butanone 4-phosphate synthase/GTP cyclohydrolase II